MEASTNSPFTSFSGTFQDRLRPSYFLEKSNIFNKMISLTHEHFWDPNDPAYINFNAPFDLSKYPVMPFETVPELCSPLAEKLTASQKISFANDSAHWWLSGFLHGEQGALSLSISLCELFQNPNAIEYAANQAREEARHVAAFTNYIQSRWGDPLPVNSVFGALLNEIVLSKQIYRKIVGMQILVEGLAMGFMASLYAKANDPVLTRLAQLVMTDETFHHKAGKLWAEYDLPELSVEEKNDAEDWALKCFQGLMFNVFNPSQKEHIYRKYGLSVEEVRAHLKTTYTEEVRRKEMSDFAGVFRILVKTLLKSGIVTDRTRSMYTKWVDLDSINDDQTEPIEDIITSEGVIFLDRINEKRKHRHKPEAVSALPKALHG